MGYFKKSIFFVLIVVFALKVKGLDLVKKEQRRSIAETEYGVISAVDVDDGSTSYHLQFFTLEPNALFLPVLLHADMVLHVKTGSGRLYWTPGDEETMTVSLQRGDIYRVPPGSIFFLKSDLQPEREKLRIHALFPSPDDEIHVSSIGAYSSVTDMVRGFDKHILQAAFKAPEEVIEAMLNSSGPAIVHIEPSLSRRKKLVQLWDWEVSFLKAFGAGRAYSGREPGSENKKQKKQKGGRTFNVFKEKADFENCNGWSLTVTKSDLPSLKQSKFGVFYVNLTKGSMMGPHWNPQASEIAMVVEGQGMVRVVCANSVANKSSDCKNTSFRVKEGDVFVVPRFHPMAQMSFNNESLVFIGFTTSTKRNYPQFLAGKASVLRVLDKDILATAFNVSNATIADLLAPQQESVILECTSCAEGEEMKMEEEIEKEKEKEREEEEKQRREEEAEREREEDEKEKEKERKEEEEKQRREEEAEREEEEEKQRREEEAEREREEDEKEKEKERKEEEEKERREEEAEREREEDEKERQEQEKRRREEEEREEREEEGEKERGETEQEAARREEKERIRWEEEEEEKREIEEEGGDARRVLRKV